MGDGSTGTRTSKHAVVVAGGGPTGMTLAAELALAGVDVAIVERRDDQALDGSRAGGLHARTIEFFDQRGIADRFLSQGQAMQIVGFHHIRLDISDFPTRHPYGLALRQKHIERILAGWVDELAVAVYRGREVVAVTQDETGVDVVLADGGRMRAEYLVGCDGGRSVVRKAAGIDFPGWDATTSWLIAEAQTAEEPKWGFHMDARGVQHAIGKAEDGGAGMALQERQVGSPGEPTLQDVRALLTEAYGTDFGIHSPTWISRFTDMTRQAAAYRDRRVLLAGDAAHVHPPMGGQGLNIGVQDAANLGWKLAQVVRGATPEDLLDTYHAERHPIGARVLRTTMAQVAARGADARTQALNEILAELLGVDQARKHLAAELSGLGIHYDFGDGHPLLGRRMPDLDIVTGDVHRRTYPLLHGARPLLLNLGNAAGVDIAAWADRVQLVDAHYNGPWELPVIGPVSAPTAVLIRPDGYVAWVGAGTLDGLEEALVRWFGSASTPGPR